MSLDKVVKDINMSKVKAPSGLSFGQELVNAANLLRDCIQNQIDIKTIGDCISASDLADVIVDPESLMIVIKIMPDLRPSVFNAVNGKVANIFWLLNDGFTVQKDWYFDGFPKKERWIYHVAKLFVEKGVCEFNHKKHLPIKVKLIERPDIYYW